MPKRYTQDSWAVKPLIGLFMPIGTIFRMTKLANAIRGLRVERLGLSQRDFAERIGLLSHSAVGRYERGEDTPSRSVLLNIWRAAKGHPEQTDILEELGYVDPSELPTETPASLQDLTSAEASILEGVLRALRNDRQAARIIADVVGMADRLRIVGEMSPEAHREAARIAEREDDPETSMRARLARGRE